MPRRELAGPTRAYRASLRNLTLPPVMVFRSTSRCPARPGHAAQQLIGQLLIDQPRPGCPAPELRATIAVPDITCLSASRQRSGDIRAWAKEHGISVSERGRIPASVVQQYQTASKGR